MRLFIGIKTGCDNHLLQHQQELKKHGTGNLTLAGNLHITLKFLGEVPPGQIKNICAAMDETQSPPFGLELKGVMLFNKSGIVAAKVGGDLAALYALYADVETALEKRGFEKEHRRYRPHVTLARKFRPFDGKDLEEMQNGNCGFTVTEMTLFESKRENGKLVYAPLHIKRLA